MAERDQRWTIFEGLRRLGPRFVLDVLRDVLSGEQRSLAEDAGRVVSLMDPAPRIAGLDRVPRSDPFVLVANHYQTSDLWVGWAAAALTHAVATVREPDRRELHWLAISEWRWFEIAGRWIPNPITSLLFPRAAKSWGMVSLPARPSDVSGRARALRRVLAYLGHPAKAGNPHPEPVGVFPEGRATYTLQKALPGSGAFLWKINSLGVPLLPAGVYLEDGALVLSFGRPFHLRNRPEGTSESLDDWARTEVMAAIGQLLPPQLWGAYSSTIAARREYPSFD
ncbi:MAG: hypothetical protein ACOX87_10010 [Chloroflexota bacterium]|jgi:1-acyl-sn-glycerol-3-phosphate acyltransferase